MCYGLDEWIWALQSSKCAGGAGSAQSAAKAVLAVLLLCGDEHCQVPSSNVAPLVPLPLRVCFFPLSGCTVYGS